MIVLTLAVCLKRTSRAIYNLQFKILTGNDNSMFDRVIVITNSTVPLSVTVINIIK